MLKLRVNLILLLMLMLRWGCVDASLWKFASGVKQLTINSLRQTILDKDSIIFEGDVEVLVGQRMHIWADSVSFDKRKQILVARSCPSSTVKIEDNDFLIFADYFELDFENKVGCANNIRIHVQEGFVSAKRAERLGQHVWQLSEMVSLLAMQIVLIGH